MRCGPKATEGEDDDVDVVCVRFNTDDEKTTVVSFTDPVRSRVAFAFGKEPTDEVGGTGLCVVEVVVAMTVDCVVSPAMGSGDATVESASVALTIDDAVAAANFELTLLAVMRSALARAAAVVIGVGKSHQASMYAMPERTGLGVRVAHPWGAAPTVHPFIKGKFPSTGRSHLPSAPEPVTLLLNRLTDG